VNIFVLLVRIWGFQYRDYLVEYDCVCVRVCGDQYKEELILNIILLVVRIWGVQ